MADVRQDIQPYVERLEALPFVRQVRGTEDSRGPDVSRDGGLTLATATGEYSLSLQILRSHLSRAHAERILSLAPRTPGLLVLAPAVGRELGARFEAAGVNFMDLAGNCFVRLGDSFMARVQGNREVPTSAVDKGLRSPSYRVVFALLAEPALVRATTRALGRASGGVSAQTASDLRARLVEQEIILATARSFRWAPDGHRRLLELWLGGASATFYPSLLVGRFRTPDRDVETLERRLSPVLGGLGVWAWGGGAAAQRLTGYYRGDSTMVYMLDPPSHQTLANKLGAVRDTHGGLTIMRAPGPLAFRDGVDTVHPLLVYTDLLLEGHARAREAAQEVFAQLLNDGETPP